MNIQAINPSANTLNCQPLRNQAVQQSAFPSFKSKNTSDGDVFVPSDKKTEEQKVDLLCRLLAYQQIQYEKLQQKTGCCI